jgi:Dolichyl-phosphate-mannose-protein mannosyltransferase
MSTPPLTPTPPPARRFVPLLLRIGLALALPIALLAWLWTAPPAAYLQRLSSCLYWVLVGSSTLALLVFGWRFRCRRDGVGTVLRLFGPGAVLAIALTALVVHQVPPQMRVQFDETCLLGVSQGMHTQRLAVMATAALPYDGTLVPVEQMVDKRPPLFAFVVSVMHDLVGYDAAHALRLNIGLLAVALFAAFVVVRRRLGAVAATCAPLLLLAVPLIIVVATSGGFELLAAVLFGCLLLAAIDVHTRPEPVRWCTFLAVGVLYAWSRYEALPVFVLVAALVWWGHRGLPGFDARCWFAAALVPVLVAPLLPLYVHARDPDFYPEAAGQPLVALQHGVAHLWPFVRAWFAPGGAHALPGPSAWLAVVAVALWLWRRRTIGYPALLVVVPVLALTLLVLFWFYGDVTEPTALRLFLPATVLTALAPLLLVALGGPRLAWLLLALVLGLLGYRGMALRRGEAFPRLQIAALTGRLDDLVRRHGGDRVLWVGAPAQYLIAHRQAALSARSYQHRFGDVQALLRQGDVRTVYLLVTPLDAMMAPAFGDVAAVLRARRAEVVEQLDGPEPITLYRLSP